MLDETNASSISSQDQLVISGGGGGGIERSLRAAL